MNRQIEFPMAPGVPPVSQNLFNENEVRWLLSVVKRRKWSIVLPTLALVGVTVIGLFLTQPKFTSTAGMALQPKEDAVVNIEDVLTTGFGDTESVLTEIEVLKSRRISTKVIDQQGLMNDPEFNDALTPDPWVVAIVKRGVATVKSLLYSLLGEPASEGLTPEQKARENVIANVQDALSVSVQPESRAVFLSFEAQGPLKAARITKAFTDAYILDMLDNSYEATLRANQWLSGKIAELQRNVTDAERAVEAYRKEANLLQGREGTLIGQQISAVNQQLLEAAAARADADTRYAQIRRLVQAGAAENSAEVLRSPIVQNLVDQEAQAKRRLAELDDDLGARHPARVSAQSALKDIQAKLRIEVTKIVNALANDAEAARARENALRQALRELEAKMASANSADVQLRSLERNADAQRTLLQNFLSRAQETTAQLDSGFQRPMARIIAEPNIPQQASFPPKTLIVALALIGGLIVFCGLAVLMEAFQRGLRSTEEVEEALGVPAVGMIPQHRRPFSSSRPLFDALAKSPNGVLAESFQSCLTQLVLTSRPTPPKSILVTSSSANEGKTTFSLGLARTAALGGYRTLVIEADLRRPAFGSTIQLPDGPGLADYLAGRADLAAVVRRDPELPLHIITAGGAVEQPANYLRSRAFVDLIENNPERYDFIICDAPPVLAVSEAQLLAPRVDGVLMVVRWGVTRRDRARLSAKQIARAGGHIVGAVLTMVDTRKHASYDFADSAYYSQYTQRHYFAKA